MSRPDWDWAAIRARVPLSVALLFVAGVWGAGAWWSFTEQRAFAEKKLFADPALLPLVIDGWAIATACVAYVASLDGRPAVPARLGTLAAVAISAASNGWWAAERSVLDPATILMGVVVPIIAMIAFEVLLVELRKTVQRARGLPAPAAIPSLRMVRLVLAPLDTFTSWREVVLNVTALSAPVPGTGPGTVPGDKPEEGSPGKEEQEEDEEEKPNDEEEDTGARRAPEPPPPARTVHKMQDARAWYRHERGQGRTPSLAEINDWIDSESYVKGRHVDKWDQELSAEQGTARLRAVGE